MGSDPGRRTLIAAPAMLPPSRFIDIPRGGDPVPDREEPAPQRPAGLLPWAIKLSLAVALVSLGTTYYLSRALDGTSRQREVRVGLVDPETTGSLAGAAARTTLDPCTASGLRR